MLSEKREKKYLADGGHECPGCGSSSITGGTLELDGSQAYVNVECDTCGATWQDIYKLAGLDNFERGDVSECDECGDQCDSVEERTNDSTETVMVCKSCADVIDSKDAKRMKD